MRMEKRKKRRGRNKIKVRIVHDERKITQALGLSRGTIPSAREESRETRKKKKRGKTLYLISPG